MTDDKDKEMKEALKIVILKGFPKRLVDSNIVEDGELSVDAQGKITFTRNLFQVPADFQTVIMKLINHLASELAIKEVDLWLQTQSDIRPIKEL